ncbi:MAG: hypothetical protein ACK559_39815, partial [bacterium]
GRPQPEEAAQHDGSQGGVCQPGRQHGVQVQRARQHAEGLRALVHPADLSHGQEHCEGAARGQGHGHQ